MGCMYSLFNPYLDFRISISCLDFLFGFADVEFIVWISYQDVLMLIAMYGFHIWNAHCGFQGLDFLAGCPFRLSERGNQVDG